MKTEAKSDYKTSLVLNYAHTNAITEIFLNNISSIKGQESLPYMKYHTMIRLL